MNKNDKVGIYLRLSKEDEKLGESGSITNQRAILMNYIKENQLNFIKEYVDDGVSGTTFDRMGFNQMIKDIEAKKINVILTKDTSRLGRDHIEFGFYVEKYFPEHNVRYIAVCDNIDTYYNNNDMLLFKSAYNDMYVKDISNKIRASLNIKKKNGEFVGAYAPYGYIKDPSNKHKLKIDIPSAMIVKRIFKMFITGYSITKITNILTQEKIPIPSIYKNMNRGLKSTLFGIWNQRTVTDILTNPTYMGNLTQGRSKKINYKSKKRIHTTKENWIMKENSCPAIIDKYTFELAQNIYQSNKNRNTSSRKREELLLRGMVYCQECGHTIGFRTIYQQNKKGKVAKIYGNCNYYLKHRNQNACTPHSLKYEELEKIVLTQCNHLLNQMDKKQLFEKLKQQHQKKDSLSNDNNIIANLEKEIKLANQKLDQMYEDKLKEIISEERYLRFQQKTISEIKIKQTQITELKKENNQVKEINDEKTFNKILENYQIDRLLLSSLIKKITYSEDGHIKIDYKIKKCNF